MSEFVDQKPPSNSGANSHRHSSGRLAFSSCTAPKAAFTSAHRSNSDSAQAARSSASCDAGGNGCAISQASGARSAGSSPSNSCRMLVPDRAGPVMNTGATTRSSAIAGLRAAASTTFSRVPRWRSRSLRVMRRPSACSRASLSSALTSRRNGSSQVGGPKSASPVACWAVRMSSSAIEWNEELLAPHVRPHGDQPPHPVGSWIIALGHGGRA